MMTRDGQPSPRQAKMMVKVFIIATLLGGLLVFLNVSVRSYNIRLQQAEEKAKAEQAGTVVPAPAGAPVPAPEAPAPGASQAPTP